ncbi:MULTISPECIES: hypothetical protein [Enterobacterales]|uniref:Uncharacterized protein n=1 Tax=Enterobacter roggenkampii TaxID=1812935 RepID=A0A837LC92_9ENTR|nr:MULTISPECIES: hypothetical protein [Enterobacterales]KLP92213.1 hypothetical protein ABF77_18685 [Enterobacter roggenkampii]MCI8156483.1 hypothetical protein [Klebsiella pneumoniae]MDP8642963.1 hypothetical protein [Serratia marcescens]HBS6529616.1 hypothetical protein [Klebsiella pneumoniae]
MKKIYRQQLEETLRVSPKTLERIVAAGKVPKPDGRDIRGHYWFMTPQLKKTIAAQKRPER